MNHYKEGINAMWEAVEEKKPKPAKSQTVEEKRTEFVDDFGHGDIVVQSDFGIVDMSEDAMKDIANGERLSYEEYLQALFNSRENRRTCLEYLYYSNAACSFKGRISRIDKKKGKIIFERIYVYAIFMNGDDYEGKEDHVWMDIEPFENYDVGDNLSFGGEIYRYLKTRNGKQISFGIRNPFDISKIKDYKLPSDDDMLLQAIDQMVCEACLFNEHCYMGMCIANKEWCENMRKTFFELARGKQ